MKILKYIFLLLLLCGIAGFVFIATQPGEYSITKKKEILFILGKLYIGPEMVSGYFIFIFKSICRFKPFSST